MQYLRTALLDKLANVVASRQTSLQRQLLRLLQSSVLGHKTHQRTVSLGEKTRRSESDDFDKTLAHVIIEGVSSPATRNVLQHWVDFVLAVSSTLQSRPPLLHTLCDCFSLRIRSAVLELQHRFAGVSGSAITGMDIVTLLSGLERLIVLSGSNNNGRKSEDGRVGNEGGSGLLGYVSGVFISDAPDEKVGKTLIVLTTAQIAWFRIHLDRHRVVACSLDGLDAAEQHRIKREYLHSDHELHSEQRQAGIGEDVSNAN